MRFVKFRGFVLHPILFVLCVAATAVAPIGCAPSARQTAIKTALVTVDTARDAFVAYDAAMQASIIDKATSVTDGKAKLAAYREARAEVSKAFDAAYHAVAAAAIANDDQSETSMQAALAQLAAAVAPYLGGSK